jgi:hypothetical protein
MKPPRKKPAMKRQDEHRENEEKIFDLRQKNLKRISIDLDLYLE